MKFELLLTQVRDVAVRVREVADECTARWACAEHGHPDGYDCGGDEHQGRRQRTRVAASAPLWLQDTVGIDAKVRSGVRTVKAGPKAWARSAARTSGRGALRALSRSGPAGASAAAVVHHRGSVLRVLALLVALLLASVLLFWRYMVPGVAKDALRWGAQALPAACVDPADRVPLGWQRAPYDVGALLRPLLQPREDLPSMQAVRAGTSGALASLVGGVKGTGQLVLAGARGDAPPVVSQELAPLPGPQAAVPVSTAPSTGVWTDGQVAAVALEVGWPAVEVPNVVRRVRAESSGDPAARDYVDGTHVGLLQLGKAERAQYGAEDGTDGRTNLAAGLRLWQARGWQPWRASDAAVAADRTPVQPVAPGSGTLQAAPAACAQGGAPGAAYAGLSGAAGPVDGLDPVTLPARAAVLASFGPMTVGGWGTRPNATEHDELDAAGRKASRALDFMVEGPRGDAVAQYLVDQAAPLRVEYLIWDRRIWSPSRGWRPYDGASPHTDHVHLTVLAAGVQTRLAG